ncbi:hypothetical protein CEXT_749161 [Caerostris extrusa]|uniref:Uncharacterized protein n=1 Tax=Caerostris extrusa TaxID=172846 RepID=A0AAV4V2U8_CAEEX|nr:hypothetical protein CEXT_749161 [Caerostris extrusa]
MLLRTPWYRPLSETLLQTRIKEQRLLVLERNYQIAVASAIIRSASHMNKHARCTCTVTTVPPTFCEVPVQPDAARCG